MDTWTRRIEGNLFFFLIFSLNLLSRVHVHPKPSRQHLYIQQPEREEEEEEEKKRVLIQLFLYLHASATIFPNIIIFQYSDLCLLREGGGKQAARWRIIFLILTTK